MRQTSSNSWLIKTGVLLDGSMSPPIDNGAVLIRDGRIIAVGPVVEVESRATGDEGVVDASEYTIMPGLIDCHQHLDKFGTPIIGTLQQALQYSVEYNCVAAVPNAKTVLEAGITSVRDIGCRGNLAVAVRDGINHGLIPGPRVVASGNIISTSAGLADFYPGWIDNPLGLGTIVNGPEEIRKAVRLQIKAGVDNIKLEASGSQPGFLPPRLPTMTLEEITIACQEAHKREKRVGAHAEHVHAVKTAIRGGVNTIEHGEYLDDEAVDLFLEHGVFLVATTSNLNRLGDMVAQGAEATGRPQWIIDDGKRRYDRWVEGFERAHKRGVKIAMGTDIANTNPHGRNAVELEYLVKYGLTPAEAIHAGTQVSAAAIGLDEVAGSLSPGKFADILLVKDNPLADIKILQDPKHLVSIIKGGEVIVDRAALMENAA
jgi:imidazolonepropionase-like amidohydrolase